MPERHGADLFHQLQRMVIERLIPGAFFDDLVNQAALVVDDRPNDDFPLPSVQPRQSREAFESLNPRPEFMRKPAIIGLNGEGGGERPVHRRRPLACRLMKGHSGLFNG